MLLLHVSADITAMVADFGQHLSLTLSGGDIADTVRPGHRACAFVAELGRTMAPIELQISVGGHILDTCDWCLSCMISISCR